MLNITHRTAPILPCLLFLGGCEATRIDAVRSMAQAPELCDEEVVADPRPTADDRPRVDARAGQGNPGCKEQCEPASSVTNEFWTTGYGAARADVVFGGSNFLVCDGNPYAMCFYSGAPVTPSVANGSTMQCTLNASGSFTCRCGIFESGPNFVSINSILNTEAYIETVRACQIDGKGCRNLENWNPKTNSCVREDDPACSVIAPVCSYLGSSTKPQTLYPRVTDSAALISTFSFMSVGGFDVVRDGTTDCTNPDMSEPDHMGYYGGCMTALCRREEDSDGNAYANCECPTWCGPYQIGRPGVGCDGNPWSASYTVSGEPPVYHCN